MVSSILRITAALAWMARREVIWRIDEPTHVVMNEIKFNKPIPDGFFSQQNMKKVR